MIDNLELLKPFLTFDTEDDFYYLQILQRKKDNPDITKNTKVIQNYFIRNMEYLESHYKEIKLLCDVFNARASLRLNKRSFKRVAFRALQNITAQMMQDDFMSAKQAYSKACGQCHNDKDKKWIVDVDEDFFDMNEVDCIAAIEDSIDLCDPQMQGGRILARVPTKTGVHLITSPFNISQFPFSSDVDIHKDNPTILYIP
jgi:hypothetical protein